MHLNDGLSLLKEEKLAAAHGSFTTAIGIDESVSVGYYYRGVVNKLMGQFDNARADFQVVVALKDRTPHALFELGKVAQITGQYDQAEKYYTKVKILYPAQSGVALLRLGDLDLERGKLQEAKDKYNASVEFDASQAEAILRLGLIEAIEKGKFETAIPFLNRAISKDSTLNTALSFRAFVNWKLNPKQSFADLSTLLRRNPRDSRLRLYRGVLSTEIGDFENAFIDFKDLMMASQIDERFFQGQQTRIDKFIDIQYAGYYLLTTIYGLPDDDVKKVKKAYCQFLTGNFVAGIQTIESVQDYRKSALCLFLLGLGNEHSSQHEAAWSFYDLALAIDNDIESAHTKRGIYLTNTEQWSAAETDFSEAIRINPQSISPYKLRGVARFFLGRYSEAVSDFNICLRHDSSDTQVLTNRAFAHLKLGNHKEAAEDFIKCSSCPTDYQAIHGNITPMLEKGDTAMFLVYVKIFAARSKDANLTLYHAKILLAQNQLQEAISTIESGVSIGFSKSDLRVESQLRTTQGIAFAKMGDYKNAEKMFSLALDQAENSLAYRERGKIFLALGKNQRAKSDLKKAFDMGDDESHSILVSIPK